MLRSGEFKRNVNLSVQWCRWILRPIGVWPESRNVPTIQKCLRRLLNAICYFLIIFLLLPGSLYVILEVHDFYDKLKLFGPLCFCVTVIFKYYLLNIHRDDIRECIERIEWDWKNVTYAEDRHVMIANAYFGRRLVFICTFFMYSGFLFFYVAIPISVGKTPAGDLNFTFIPMVFPFSRYIVDTRYSPANELCFSLQLLAGILMHAITSAACSLAAVFAVHACGQMQVLASWLQHLVDGRSDMGKSLDSRIAKIIFGTYREGTSEWSLNHFTDAITYAILLVSLTFNIFIFCYIGEIVANECRKVGEMTYMIEWYRLRGSKKLCCVLIIAMSNSSTKLTAGNMVELSIYTFSDVVKTSVAFLNVLRTLT